MQLDILLPEVHAAHVGRHRRGRRILVARCSLDRVRSAFSPISKGKAGITLRRSQDIHMHSKFESPALKSECSVLIRNSHSASRKAIVLFLIACLGSLIGDVTDAKADSRSVSSSDTSQFVCSPDRPVVAIGENVHLRVWALVPRAKQIEYKWAATGGKLEPNGSEALWSFDGVDPDVYSSSVSMILGQQVSRCSVRVLVVGAERGPIHETGRTFLLKGTSEQSGYGLYSYLLFGSAPEVSSRGRYLEAINAYLTIINSVDDLKDYVPVSKLNVTYLPIKLPSPPKPTAAWILENYDFARARAILDELPGDYHAGLYLVSALRPLTDTQTKPDHYLFQDLTTVPDKPPELISWWVREFLNQAAQERFWNTKNAELLELRLRTTISVIAAGLPEVQEQLNNWIKWTG
jgi:hypothetical protein